ncbi:MAG: hypothetical protein QXG40_04375 [Ignisphaera sp.]
MLVKRLRLTLKGTDPQSGPVTFDISDDTLQSLLKSYGVQNLAQCVICSYNVLQYSGNTIPTISYSVKLGSNPRTLDYTIAASNLGTGDTALVNFIIMIPHSIIR